MAAITGKEAHLKNTAATYSTSTGEAFTSLSGTTDRFLFKVTDATKRQWTRAVDPVVYVLTTAHTDFATNFVQGKVTFGTALTTAEGDAVTGDVFHLTSSYLPGVREWTLDVDNTLHDVTTLSTSTSAAQWRTFVAGLQGATVDLSAIVDTPTTATPLWFDHINTDQDVIVELNVATAGTTYKFEGYARVDSDGYTGPRDGLLEEGVTLTVDGPLFYATTE